MKDIKNKDNLTDLVDEVQAQSDTDTNEDNNGTVSAPTGEKVELDFNPERRDLANKLLKEARNRQDNN